jgi:DNA-directed RNA polymerase specialized sigma24 family protein
VIKRRTRHGAEAEHLRASPAPDELLGAPVAGPEALYDARESVSLAFLTVLQLLPARQRAVLILRDVLAWRAAEVATLP